jgi:NodT family efflux transporter outer membrane factor (OMF) lipoprotein
MSGEGVSGGRGFLSWLPSRFSVSETPPIPRPQEAWWETFESAELNQLVEQALNENFDLRSAVARLSQARAQMIIDGSARFPTIDVTGGVGVDGPSGGIGTAQDRSSWDTRELWQVGVLLNYEVNLWGRDEFSSEAAYNRALASDFQREALALSLTAEVVRTYFEVLALTERVEVAEQNLAAVSAIERGLQARLEQGDATLIDVTQQRILLNTVSSQVDAIEIQKHRAQSRLASLIGQPPGSLRFESNSVTAANLPMVDAGLPSDLLCRRPDIKRAEATLLSAQLDIQAARANLLPSFALSASTGLGSFELSNLLAPESIFINATADLVQNVFDGGRREAEVALASARETEFLNDYANTVLTSLREVEDALVGVQLNSSQYNSMRDASDLADQLSEYSVELLERGGMDYLRLFEIQRTVLETQDLSIVARYNQITSTINLIKAIGGGLNAGSVSECVGEEGLPMPTAAWSQAAGHDTIAPTLRPELVSY